jgi:hypothetical protein
MKNQLEQDISFVKKALPEHYTVQESKSVGSIHCRSSIGIREGIDGEDDEHWGFVMAAFRQHFGVRFREVFHNTCFCHVDFTVYLRDF